MPSRRLFCLALALASLCFVSCVSHDNSNSSDLDSLALAAPSGAVKVEQSVLGKMPDQREVHLFTMTNSSGMKVKVMTLGGLLMSVEVPDRDGVNENVTLSLDTFQQYLIGHHYLGPVVGRFANRIAAGEFSLDGKDYMLATNNGPNHLHGGLKGFDKQVWTGKVIQEKDGAGVELSLVSPDGNQGYPGELKVTTVYSLNDKNELKIRYTATTNKPTIVNLTNHAFWNLGGIASGKILDHVLTLNADHFLPVDAVQIPTGEIRSVKGSPMDFRTPLPIGARISAVPGGYGYDHNYILNKKQPKELSWAATLKDPKTGRVMDVYTTQPGVQLYTTGRLNGSLASNGHKFAKNTAVCLETQHFPDSPHHPSFPTTVLRPGEVYTEETVHRFYVEAAE